jgi:hypothetical protein
VAPDHVVGVPGGVLGQVGVDDERSVRLAAQHRAVAHGDDQQPPVGEFYADLALKLVAHDGSTRPAEPAPDGDARRPPPQPRSQRPDGATSTGLVYETATD